MNKLKLIEKGYFAKELPPCFNTKLFADNFDFVMHECETKKSGVLGLIISQIESRTDINDNEKAIEKHIAKTKFNNELNYSACVKYNIPKIGISRKEIKIPNPLHQGKLVISICNNFSEIQNIYDNSVISVTKPVEETEDFQGRRAVRHDTFTQFKEKCILHSFDKQLQLKTDISKYYHSIYTHSIPWATIGKQAYKRNYALSDKDPAKLKNLFGELLDECMMSCQSQQTKGIPIGPDTSLIIAEIIGCHIDNLLVKQLKKDKIEWSGYRFYDDFYLYFSKNIDAEIAVDRLQKILSDFELELNHEKTEIKDKPITIEEDWALRLKSFFFRAYFDEQKEDIWNYFALMFNFAKDNPKDSVLKFALNKFNFVRVEKENFDLFEQLLLKVGLLETSTLQAISKILVSYKSLISKERIKKFCFVLIRQHFDKQHDYELTWALWLIKTFKISITKEIVELVILSNSITANIILLDLLQHKSFRLDLNPIIEKITTENLATVNWLLVYETVYNNWIPSLSKDIIKKSYFFKILYDKRINFYDKNAELEPIKVPKSLLRKILRKTNQLEKSLQELKSKNKELKSKFDKIISNLNFKEQEQNLSRDTIQNRLADSERLINSLITEIAQVKEEQNEFKDKKVYFVLGKRLEELHDLTIREIDLQSKEDTDLLFDPRYL